MPCGAWGLGFGTVSWWWRAWLQWVAHGSPTLRFFATIYSDYEKVEDGLFQSLNCVISPQRWLCKGRLWAYYSGYLDIFSPGQLRFTWCWSLSSHLQKQQRIEVSWAVIVHVFLIFIGSLRISCNAYWSYLQLLHLLPKIPLPLPLYVITTCVYSLYCPYILGCVTFIGMWLAHILSENRPSLSQ